MANRVECHLFSGLFGVGAKKGTKTLEKLIDDLPHEYDARHHRHGRWEWVRDGIISRNNQLGPATIILIGHSYGARRCQQIAAALNKSNIDVQYIAGIDPTALTLMQKPMKITKNVKSVDEFHATSGVCHRARKRDPSGGQGGKYIIPNSLKPKHKVITVPGGHKKCASAKITRKRIVKQVRKIFDSL